MEKKETPQDRYAKRNIVAMSIRLNKKTDADIFKKLSEVPNKQGYIKALIREDILKGEPDFQKELENLFRKHGRK